MLVKVTAENFKSFEETAELTMVSSAKIRKNNEHKVTIKRVNLLKSAVVYGANASGKSNLVEILRFMKYCFLKGIPWFLASGQLLVNGHTSCCLVGTHR